MKSGKMKNAPAILISFLFLAQITLAQEKTPRDTLVGQLGTLRTKIESEFKLNAHTTDSLNKRIVFLEHMVDSLNLVLHPAPKAKKSKNNSTVSKVVTSVLGKDAVEPISNSENLTAYIIESSRASSPLIDGAEYLQGYRILNKVSSVRSGDARELRQILLDDKNYDPAAPVPKCIFSPFLVYEFTEKGKVLDMFICLTCNQFEIWSGGKLKTAGSIRKSRTKLIESAKKIFPEDATIQTLK